MSSLSSNLGLPITPRFDLESARKAVKDKPLEVSPIDISPYGDALMRKMRQIKLDPMSTIKCEIMESELAATIQFIQDNPDLIQYVKKEGGGFLERNTDELSKTLYISRSGVVIINCKLHTPCSEGIGCGVMKTVTLSINFFSGQMYAYGVSKIMGPEVDGVTVRKNAALAEHRIGYALRGLPNVVDFVEVVYYMHKGFVKQGVYTPFYDRGDLYDLVIKWDDMGKLGWVTNEVKRLGYGILGGLVAIHEKKIIHRDIKPENIFLDRCKDSEREVQDAFIGDFGLCTKDAPGSDWERLVGTPPYTSPQWWEIHDAMVEAYSDPTGTTVIDLIPFTQKEDVYAAGLVLGMIFMGIFPGNAGTDRTTDAYRKMAMPAEGTFEYVVWKMTRDSVDERCTSQEAFDLAGVALGFVKKPVVAEPVVAEVVAEVVAGPSVAPTAELPV